MTNFFDNGDDLNDLLGNDVPAAPRALPTDAGLTRIRETVPQFVETCPSCRGTGRFVSYSGRPLGQCFKCKGKGSKTFKTSSETRMQNRAKAATKAANAAQSNWEAFVAAHPAEAEVLTKGIAQTFGDGRWNGICADIKGKVEKYGDLHEGTMAMLGRAVERAAARAAQKAQVAVQNEGFTFANLQAAFDAVRQRGAKKAQITIGELNISLAAGNGRNPGALYVKVRGEYMGKIAADGRWFPGRDAHATIGTQLAEIDRDPQAAIKVDALARARKIAEAELAGEQIEVPCGCCGILLTDPVSRERGIGPICAGKWGF